MRNSEWTGLLRRACTHVVLILAFLGGAILDAKSKLIWTAIVIAGILVPVFFVWVAAALLCYAYARYYYKSQPQGAWK